LILLNKLKKKLCSQETLVISTGNFSYLDRKPKLCSQETLWVEGIPLRVEKVEKKSTHTLDFKNQ